MIYGDNEYGSVSLADIIAEIIQVVFLRNIEVLFISAHKDGIFILENKQNIFKVKADDF